MAGKLLLVEDGCGSALTPSITDLQLSFLRRGVGIPRGSTHRLGRSRLVQLEYITKVAKEREASLSNPRTLLCSLPPARLDARLGMQQSLPLTSPDRRRSEW